MSWENLSGSLRYDAKCRHRRSPRVPTDARVDYTSAREILLDHRVVDVGLDGICLRVPALEAVGQIVDLCLQFPGVEETIEAKGEVMWAQEEPQRRIGVRFVELTKKDRAVLRKVIYRKA